MFQRDFQVLAWANWTAEITTAVTPEPSTMALSCLAAAGLAVLLLRWRRNGKRYEHVVLDHSSPGLTTVLRAPAISPTVQAEKAG